MGTKRKPATRLKKSKLEDLYRHRKGPYYARVKVNGKSKRANKFAITAKSGWILSNLWVVRRLSQWFLGCLSI